MKNENIEFETSHVQSVKIHYKNGTTYHVKGNLTDFVVFRKPSGLCDVSYAVHTRTHTDYGTLDTVNIHNTDTQDVVAIEAKNLVVDGVNIDKAYIRF